MVTLGPRGETGSLRAPAVAGAFYPASRLDLRDLVAWQLGEAKRQHPEGGAHHGGVPQPPSVPTGMLVPHAGLEYSGTVAAAGWRLLEGWSPGDAEPPAIVILGTNHRAGWLDGIAAWDRGSWHTPVGDAEVDDPLAGAIVELGPPFLVDRTAHLEEHSIEVQLPFVLDVAPRARIVPLAVSTGIGDAAIEAGARLGALLATRRAAGAPIVLAISSDMAHYPSGLDAEAVTASLLPAILGLDPAGLAGREVSLRQRAAMGRGLRGLACGMCGIEPTVVGLAALRALGATHGTALAAATSADAGGPRDRTVGYLAVRFD